MTLVLFSAVFLFASCSDNNNVELEISSPENNEEIEAGAMVRVMFTATDGMGLSSLQVSQQQMSIDSIIVIDDSRLEYEFDASWMVPAGAESGTEYEFRISANSVDGGGDETTRTIVVQ